MLLIVLVVGMICLAAYDQHLWHPVEMLACLFPRLREERGTRVTS